MKDLKYANGNIHYINQELAKLEQSKSWRLKVTEWKDKRGLSANAQMHVFFGAIGKFQSVPMVTAKSRCKIDFGLPIIFNRDDEYSRVVDYILTNSGFYKMSREKQEIFITAIAITSEFNTAESKVFMDNIIFYWNDKGLNINYKDN